MWRYINRYRVKSPSEPKAFTINAFRRSNKSNRSRCADQACQPSIVRMKDANLANKLVGFRVLYSLFNVRRTYTLNSNFEVLPKGCCWMVKCYTKVPASRQYFELPKSPVTKFSGIKHQQIDCSTTAGRLICRVDAEGELFTTMTKWLETSKPHLSIISVGNTTLLIVCARLRNRSSHWNHHLITASIYFFSCCVLSRSHHNQSSCSKSILICPSSYHK